jgi:uncharacterized membrane protein YeiH
VERAELRGDRRDHSPGRNAHDRRLSGTPKTTGRIGYTCAVTTEPSTLLVLDLTGTFAFALNGALTAIRVAKLDVVGVVTLGMITALGGGIIRDILIDSLPPATFSDWRYLLVAAVGSLLAFGFSPRLTRLAVPILILDAAGLSLFAVTGASKALDFGVGGAQAAILGAITAVGGGTLRDALTGRVPFVLRSELYAIPALAAATVVVITDRIGAYALPAALAAAALCFVVRMLGIRYGLNAPSPPGADPDRTGQD